MEYRKIGGTYYIRMDRGDEIISTLMDICRKEGTDAVQQCIDKKDDYTVHHFVYDVALNAVKQFF